MPSRPVMSKVLHFKVVLPLWWTQLSLTARRPLLLLLLSLFSLLFISLPEALRDEEERRRRMDLQERNAKKKKKRRRRDAFPNKNGRSVFPRQRYGMVWYGMASYGMAKQKGPPTIRPISQAGRCLLFLRI